MTEVAADRLFVAATAVAVGGDGVLIRGPSGSGKSDLALRLIDAGARLVGDDGVEIARHGGNLVIMFPLDAPEELRGWMEVRGLGIMPVSHVQTATLCLVVDLVPPTAIERLPEPEAETILGVEIPLLRLAPFEASAAAKLRLAVGALGGAIIPAR